MSSISRSLPKQRVTLLAFLTIGIAGCAYTDGKGAPPEREEASADSLARLFTYRGFGLAMNRTTLMTRLYGTQPRTVNCQPDIGRTMRCEAGPGTLGSDSVRYHHITAVLDSKTDSILGLLIVRDARMPGVSDAQKLTAMAEALSKQWGPSRDVEGISGAVWGDVNSVAVILSKEAGGMQIAIMNLPSIETAQREHAVAKLDAEQRAMRRVVP